jgi:hypothetical protein
MSHHIPIPRAEKFDPKKGALLKTIFQGALVVGLLGALAMFIFGEGAASRGAHAWVFAFFYGFTVLVGCFFWLCLHHATDTEWSVVIRRQIENLAALLKWCIVIFLPLALICLIKPDLLYKWFAADPGDSLLAGSKSYYLNKPFFWIRVVLIFGGLGWMSHILRKRSMAQDVDGKSVHTFKNRFWAVAGIPTLALGLTFGGIDWLKALNHHWYSTMWGVYLFAGAAGASMAVIVLTCKWLQSQGYLKVVNEEHYHLMGKFLFAFTVFWGYIGFSQYMLITYANIDEETIYFRIRNTGSWNWMSWFLVFGRFFFMFVPLLFQGLKKTRGIIFCAAWILFMHFIDLFIIVIPEYSPDGFSFGAFLACVFSLLAVIGVLGLGFLKNVRQGYVFPTKDPRLAESLKFTN